MKTWKKVLIGVGAALVLGIIVAVTVYQSRKNLVTVQTGKVDKQNLASVVSASGEIKPRPTPTSEPMPSAESSSCTSRKATG